MITAIVGKPGMGKSFQLVRLAWQAIRGGRDVYSNVLIDFSKLMKKRKKPYGRLYYWHELSQFTYIHNGLVLIDEVGAYFDSRSYAKFPEDVRIKFQQYRKDGLDIYYTVQAYSRADLIIRQLTNYVLECKRMYWLFWATNYYPEEYEKAGLDRPKTQGSFFYVFNKRIAESYDTTQSINRLDKSNPYKFPLMADIINERNTKGGDMN